jgi:hypothetical protein
MEYNYGDAYKRYPLGSEPYVFGDGSTVKVHDIFDPLPEFMQKADIVFTDPPWNLTNLNTFYTKAERSGRIENFELFYVRLFGCVAEIRPSICYIEVGKQYLADFVIAMRRLYKHVTFYNSGYYHKRDNRCYVVRGGVTAKKPALDDIDEEDIIKWVCANEEYECIGDLCIGRGLVGFYAHAAGKRFVGTELNHKRLSVLLERIDKGGIK